MFSKACEHGIKAVTYIATQSLEKRRTKITDIVENSGSPEAFTAKVLGVLTKKKIVDSHKGPNGGFDIKIDRMKEVKLQDIVHAIDGDEIYTGCALGLHECDDMQPCPVHAKFKLVKKKLNDMLESTSIYDLALGLKEGKTYLIRESDIMK